MYPFRIGILSFNSDENIASDFEIVSISLNLVQVNRIVFRWLNHFHVMSMNGVVFPDWSVIFSQMKMVQLSKLLLTDLNNRIRGWLMISAEIANIFWKIQSKIGNFCRTIVYEKMTLGLRITIACIKLRIVNTNDHYSDRFLWKIFDLNSVLTQLTNPYLKLLRLRFITNFLTSGFCDKMKTFK